MFEHYTEKARRAIFFARYEASQFGSREIEPEHLLLGVVRQSGEMKHRLNGDSMREAVGRLLPHLKQISTSIDLPLTVSAKRVLAFSAEEAKRLSHDYIDVPHLVLGLLREEDTHAARLIREAGCTLEDLRKETAEAPPATARIPGGASGARLYQMLNQAGLSASREELQRLMATPERIRELELVLGEIQTSVANLTQEIRLMNQKLDQLLERGK
jgi:ATP-dependent Clp protease ATP-binding subunit ClpC